MKYRSPLDRHSPFDFVPAGPPPKLPPRLILISESYYCAPVIQRPGPVVMIQNLPPIQPRKPKLSRAQSHKVARIFAKIKTKNRSVEKLLPKVSPLFLAKKPHPTHKRPPQFRKHGHPRKQKGMFN